MMEHKLFAFQNILTSYTFILLESIKNVPWSIECYVMVGVAKSISPQTVMYLFHVVVIYRNTKNICCAISKVWPIHKL